jgi:hypothetical protein
MNPMIITAEVTAAAEVITQDDPRHPAYINPEEEKENNK